MAKLSILTLTLQQTNTNLLGSRSLPASQQMASEGEELFLYVS